MEVPRLGGRPGIRDGEKERWICCRTRCTGGLSKLCCPLEHDLQCTRNKGQESKRIGCNNDAVSGQRTVPLVIFSYERLSRRKASDLMMRTCNRCVPKRPRAPLTRG